MIEENGECRVQDLAKHFDVSHVTVSKIVSRLISEGLLTSEPYKPIFLTARGKRLAQKVKKRHEIVMDFLLWLGVDEDTAKIDSEGIEHHVSEKTLEAMKSAMESK